MSIRARWEGSLLRYFDRRTHETARVIAPVWLKEDFVCAALDATNRIALLDTGEATEALGADLANGILALALTATSEAQLAGMSYGDQRPFILNQGLNFEARFRFSVLPTTGAIVCVGLMGDHHATADTVAESIWFRADANGAITVESDDTANERTKIATGVTLTTDDWIVARIDCTNIADVKFYINGERVAEGTTFNMSAVAGLKLQPVARINKASGTGVGTVELDYFAVWQKRAA